MCGFGEVREGVFECEGVGGEVQHERHGGPQEDYVSVGEARKRGVFEVFFPEGYCLW